MVSGSSGVRGGASLGGEERQGPILKKGLEGSVLSLCGRGEPKRNDLREILGCVHD